MRKFHGLTFTDSCTCFALLLLIHSTTPNDLNIRNNAGTKINKSTGRQLAVNSGRFPVPLILYVFIRLIFDNLAVWGNNRLAVF